MKGRKCLRLARTEKLHSAACLVQFRAGNILTFESNKIMESSFCQVQVGIMTQTEHL